jgi:glycosyltransferase involved in cell wall biosynthesis
VPSLELRIYGSETPFLQRVLASVRSNDLLDTVRYLGPRRPEGIVAAIAECDVGIVPNHRSVFTEINTPTRIFEYLALGKPVIAPRAPGIRDYFKEGTLIFFELGDGEDLARKIEYVYLNPSEAINVVKRGQEVYLAHTWREERQILVNLASELVSRD